ncbi:hypothetical protein HAX54_000703 [Datura stramonium]|uniref:Uncharacterized protein n=1 Tax=Datura stramonium TaxID=4076 RepID=A0ABS8T213_DATST|nr:hypothetical protein [Datura stramonium]
MGSDGVGKEKRKRGRWRFCQESFVGTYDGAAVGGEEMERKQLYEAVWTERGKGNTGERKEEGRWTERRGESETAVNRHSKWLIVIGGDINTCHGKSSFAATFDATKTTHEKCCTERSLVKTYL